MKDRSDDRTAACVCVEGKDEELIQEWIDKQLFYFQLIN